MSVTIVKLGGSLLARPDLAVRLRGVLAELGDVRPLLIVGGGAAADVVRNWDRVHGLGDEAAHELAIRSLGLTSALLVQLVPETLLCPDRAAAEKAWKTGRRPVLDVASFLDAEEAAAGERLPRSWDVTTDSIAAWIATRWPADELVLWKATPLPVPEPVDWSLVAARGGVDAAFPGFASAVRRIRWIGASDEPSGRSSDDRERVSPAPGRRV